MVEPSEKKRKPKDVVNNISEESDYESDSSSNVDSLSEFESDSCDEDNSSEESDNEYDGISESESIECISRFVVSIDDFENCSAMTRPIGIVRLKFSDFNSGSKLIVCHNNHKQNK